jgi:hypothetical protein
LIALASTLLQSISAAGVVGEINNIVTTANVIVIIVCLFIQIPLAEGCILKFETI